MQLAFLFNTLCFKHISQNIYISQRIISDIFLSLLVVIAHREKKNQANLPQTPAVLLIRDDTIKFESQLTLSFSLEVEAMNTTLHPFKSGCNESSDTKSFCICTMVSAKLPCPTICFSLKNGWFIRISESNIIHATFWLDYMESNLHNKWFYWVPFEIKYQQRPPHASIHFPKVPHPHYLKFYLSSTKSI